MKRFIVAVIALVALFSIGGAAGTSVASSFGCNYGNVSGPTLDPNNSYIVRNGAISEISCNADWAVQVSLWRDNSGWQQYNPPHADLQQAGINCGNGTSGKNDNYRCPSGSGTFSSGNKIGVIQGPHWGFTVGQNNMTSDMATEYLFEAGVQSFTVVICGDGAIVGGLVGCDN
jgi:hypothetical protein